MRALATAVIVALAMGGCKPKKPEPAAASELAPTASVAPGAVSSAGGFAAPRYLKGSTHVHTGTGSGDSSTPVHEVARWYEEHGYDFIIVTDHNRVTHYEHGGELLVLDGVELTNNPGSCADPKPVRGAKCRIHVNALAVTERPEGDIDWRERASRARIDKYARGLETSAALGGLAQINHPTWYWGMDAKLLAELGRRGAKLVEIANSQFGIWNHGDDRHVGTEALWDEVLTAGVVMWAVASDDAHHYFGYGKYPAGGGWVMVRAEKNAQSVRSALERGDFYSSSGVVLDRVEVAAGSLSIEAAGGDDVTITFIGTGGATLAERGGTEARFVLADAPTGYVRAVVTDGRGRKAWIQPFPVP